MKKIFKYLENLWLGKDNKPSVRRVLAIVLSIDFVINVHKSVDIMYKVVTLFLTDRVMDAVAISSLGGGIANIAMILGLEAGLIAALLALTTYQNHKFNNELPQDQ